MSTFIPIDLMAQLQQSLRDNLNRSSEMLFGPQELRRRGHVERTPYTAEELANRREAIKRWKKLNDELLAKGWLNHDSCHECGGELVPSTETEHTQYVYDETEDEYKARVPEPHKGPFTTHHTLGNVTIPVLRTES